MAKKNLNILGSQTSPTSNRNKLQKNSIYKISKDLINDGFKFDSEGLYCPLKATDGVVLYLKVEREHQSYAYAIGPYDTKFIAETPTFNSKKSICAEDSKRNRYLFEKFKKINDNGKDMEMDDFNDAISEIGVKLNRESDFQQITKEFGVYKNKEVPDKSGEDNNFLIDIEGRIQYRRNPQLTKKQKENAKMIEGRICADGFIPYLDGILDNIHIGSHKNIYRKVLAGLNIMRGKASYLFETTARAGEGKSLEDDIAFSMIIPQDYIFKKNNMTVASFLRYGEVSSQYFTRLIVLFGDFGSKKSFQKIEEVFDVFKILITENEYSKDLSEQNSSGNYENKTLDLTVESIGGVYSTTLNSFTDADPQLESRTLKSTPFENKDDDILDLIFDLNFYDSKQSIAKREAEAELLLFQSYLLSLVNFDREIINPYKNVFKRYLKGSSVPFRELKQLLGLFDAYCVLTNYDCEEKNGYLVASEKQLTEFLTDVCLDNVLIPYESNFIDMLKNNKNKNSLKIIQEKTDEDEEGQYTDPLQEYFNKVLEEMEINDGSFSDLPDYLLKQALNKLLKFYKLGGTSTEHEENIFFRKRDVKRIYGRYKAYKNIDDVGKLLHNLYLKGYLNKLEFKDPNNHENIYYLTSKCENIKFSLVIDEEDQKQIETFLKELGLDAD